MVGSMDYGGFGARASNGAVSGFFCNIRRSHGRGADFRSELLPCLKFFAVARCAVPSCFMNQTAREVRTCCKEAAARARIGSFINFIKEQRGVFLPCPSRR